MSNCCLYWNKDSSGFSSLLKIMNTTWTCGVTAIENRKGMWESYFWKGCIECVCYTNDVVSVEEKLKGSSFQGVFLEERLSTGTASGSWLPPTWLSVLSKQNGHLYDQYGKLEESFDLFFPHSGTKEIFL